MRSKIFKTLSSLVLTVVLAAGLTITADAKESSVHYEGGAEKFVFLPGSDYSETDLFDNFKGVMPGDVLSQTVTVKNDYKDCDKVKIYLRAEPHKEDGSYLSNDTEGAIADAPDMQDFLRRLSMTVKNGNEVIYTATADQLDGLKENVALGTFRYGEETKLTVELTVPMELDNTYANRIGEVDWIFSVKELSDSGEGGNHGGGHHHSESTPASVQTSVVSVKTGDSANLILWGSLLGVSVLGLAVLAFARRRRREDA